MKRWWLVTTLLYALIIAVLAWPLCMLFASDQTAMETFDNLYDEVGLWICVGIFALTQVLLLAIPVRVAERRPVARRHISSTAIAIAFCFALLFLLAGSCLLLSISESDGAVEYGVYAVAATSLLSWIVWSVLLYRHLRMNYPAHGVDRLVRWVYRGSIAELLVAVPTHIIVRQRDDCCAPFVTMMGIATGLSLMLLCYGPGVFFLFAARVRRLRATCAPESAVLSDGTAR